MSQVGFDQINWERRNYGSPEAYLAMKNFMLRMKRESIEAGKKSARTLKRRKSRSLRP